MMVLFVVALNVGYVLRWIVLLLVTNALSSGSSEGTQSITKGLGRQILRTMLFEYFLSCCGKGNSSIPLDLKDDLKQTSDPIL